MRLFKRARSQVWQCSYKDRTGHWVFKSTGRTDKAAARDVAHELERRALRDPRDTAAEAATVTDALTLLSEHCAHQVAAGELAEATGDFYANKAGHVLRVFGAKTLLGDVDAAAVRRYHTTRQQEGAGSHTIIKELTALRVALRLAVERGWWKGSLETLVPPGIKASYVPRERWLPLAEVRALMEELKPGHAAVVAFAVATGAERAAIDRAERADITLARTRGQVVVRGSKNANRLRTVPVVLAEARELLKYVLKNADGGGERLFRPWHTVNRDLVAACARAGIARCSPNDLRRTYAHWHYQAGVTLDVLAPAMGHATTTMLSRVYAKPSAAELDAKMRSQVKPAKKSSPKKATKKTRRPTKTRRS